MDKRQFASNLKKQRENKGITQEHLAEISGVSLRTIQRIESAEVTPRHSTTVLLCAALNISPSELADWSSMNNRQYLAAVNLSALFNTVSMPLGIIIPLLLWLIKKDTITGLEKTSRKVINFQITWTILIYAVGVYSFFLWKGGYYLLPLLVGSNIVISLINAFRAYQGKEEKYFPSIKFLRY